MKNLKSIAFALFGLTMVGQACAITVDGNLSDWGITPGTSWVPNAGVHYAIEDQTGGLNTYLTPGYGGQAYDAEALYATIDSGKLYIALATGHNPLLATSGNNYGAGDFAIDFGKNGSYELGINFRNPDGISAADTFGQNGGLYQVSQWYYGLWNAAGAQDSVHPDPAHPTSIRSGTLLGTTSFAYTTVGQTGYGASAADSHYFYEMSVDLSLLTAAGWDGSAFNIHWTENCANDSILVDPGHSVSEPGSLALLGVSLFGLLGLRRRTRH